jgi:hypothetical protein
MKCKFKKWVLEKLVHNLIPHAVIVVDMTPYLCIQPDNPHSSYALRSDMIS